MKIFDKTITLFHCDYENNVATKEKLQPVYYDKTIKTIPSEKGLQYSNQLNVIIPAYTKPQSEIKQNDKIVVGDVDFVVDGSAGHMIKDLMKQYPEQCFNIIAKEEFYFDERKNEINHIEIIGV